MNLLTKLSIVGALSLVGGVMGAGCTVNSTSTVGDGGTTPATDSGSHSDSSTGDSGGYPSGDAGTDASDGGSCQLSVQINDATCTACMQSNCCEETNGCFDDTDCDALVTCINNCGADSGGVDGGFQQCGQNCLAAHPNSQTKYSSMSACGNDKCATPCGF